jgi:CrcB protein
MSQILAIGIGGALGSIARFLTSTWIHAWLGRGFPYGTFIVNVSGCIAMGFLFALFAGRLDNNDLWRSGILIGVLGGYTTFSSFSIEAFNLIEEGQLTKALIYMMGSLVLSVLGTWLGVILGRQL